MLRPLKTYIKNLLRERGLKLMRPFVRSYILRDVFKRRSPKRMLLCHLSGPFKTGIQYRHTAFAEAYEIARVFDGLGYSVDVVDWDNDNITLDDVNITEYQVVFGQGFFMDKIFLHPGIAGILTIHYATGSHPFFLNHKAFDRLRQNQTFTRRYLAGSILFNRFLFPLQTSIADRIFIWGNEFTRQTYLPYYLREPERLHCLPAFFYKTREADPEKRSRNFDQIKRHYLFFGSSRFIHRGLDLLIEYFSGQPDLVLHVCGALDSEPEFLLAYREKIGRNNNIRLHGFVDVRSDTFGEILEQCAYYIYPSASEGSSASVITVVGNGALVPVIPPECGIDSASFGVPIDAFSPEGIDRAVNLTRNIDAGQYKTMSTRAYQYVNAYHSRENFGHSLRAVLDKILPHEGTAH